MKAIILNSGLGSRMGSRTSIRPKCLVELVDGRSRPATTIVSAQLAMLRELGIDEVVMTTGFGDAILRSYIAQRFPELEIEYVMNPLYAETNYIYSLYLIDHRLDDDVLLLHGDMVFERAALERLLFDPAKNGVIVNLEAALPEKDFKARIEGDRILEIGVDLSGDDCRALFPVYKLSSSFYAAWSREIAAFVDRGETGVYAENALNVLLRSEQSQGASPQCLAPIHFGGLCMEVDTAADLARARRLHGASVLREARLQKRRPSVAALKPTSAINPNTMGNDGSPR